MPALLRRGSARFGLLIALILIFHVTYRHTVWLPRAGQHPEAFTFLSISDATWHSAGWLAFFAVLLTLFAPSVRPVAPASDLPFRRLTVLALVVAYSVTAVLRLATGRTFGIAESVGPGVLALVAVLALGCAVALVRWPPPTSWLLGAMLAFGVVLRAALQALIPPDAGFADNLPAIEMSLDRLRAGLTPYAIHDFGSHTNPMPYLPLSFLVHLPAHLLGLDIRVTNLVLATALTLVAWLFLRALPLPATARSGLALATGVLFVLPVRLSHDLFTAWPLFNLLLTCAFGLVALARMRLAAAFYGASLAAMPVAAFVAPPLFLLAVRTRPLREVAVLAAIVAAVGGLPTLLFILWDADAFFRAFLFGTTGLWGSLAAGRSELPLMLWHGWLGGWLLAVQAALVAAVVILSWTRLRNVRGLIALAAVLYLGLVITGPHIAQYMTGVVLYLALLHEAARAAAVTPGDRELGLAT